MCCLRFYILRFLRFRTGGSQDLPSRVQLGSRQDRILYVHAFEIMEFVSIEPLAADDFDCYPCLYWPKNHLLFRWTSPLGTLGALLIASRTPTRQPAPGLLDHCLFLLRHRHLWCHFTTRQAHQHYTTRFDIYIHQRCIHCIRLLCFWSLLLQRCWIFSGLISHSLLFGWRSGKFQWIWLM